MHVENTTDPTGARRNGETVPLKIHEIVFFSEATKTLQRRMDQRD